MIRTKSFAVCPHCNATDSVVDHLKPGDSAGPWYCDSCGKSYTLKVSKDGATEIMPSNGWKIDTIDVLILPPQPKAIIFAVPGMRFDSSESVVDDKHYYYEEHSCPTNWLKPDFMYYDGDPDPHGVIRFSGWWKDGSRRQESELIRVSRKLLETEVEE